MCWPKLNKNYIKMTNAKHLTIFDKAESEGLHIAHVRRYSNLVNEVKNWSQDYKEQEGYRIVSKLHEGQKVVYFDGNFNREVIIEKISPHYYKHGMGLHCKDEKGKNACIHPGLIFQF